jgi:integrase
VNIGDLGSYAGNKGNLSVACQQHRQIRRSGTRTRNKRTLELMSIRRTVQRRPGVHQVGTPLDPSHVRRDFRRAISGIPGLDPAERTPRELRHSFVSLLSDHGVPLEEISRLVGHSSTAVTGLVYRKQIRPVIQSGAVTMDRHPPRGSSASVRDLNANVRV